MLARLRRTVRNEDGASAVEYGLLVAAIAAVIIVIVFAFGGVIQQVFKNTTCTVATKAGTAAQNITVPDNQCAAASATTTP